METKTMLENVWTFSGQLSHIQRNKAGIDHESADWARRFEYLQSYINGVQQAAEIYDWSDEKFNRLLTALQEVLDAEISGGK